MNETPTNTFRFKVYSWRIFALTFLISITIGGLFIIFTTPPDALITLLIMTVFFNGGLSISLYISKSVIEYKISEQSVSIKWTRTPIFQHRIDQNINWNEIESYKFIPDWRWALFKIKMVDGSIIRFWRWRLWDKDDFEQFVSSFKAHVNKVNKEPGTSKQIKRETLFRERKYGLFILIILAVFILILGFYLTKILKI